VIRPSRKTRHRLMQSQHQDQQTFNWRMNLRAPFKSSVSYPHSRNRITFTHSQVSQEWDGLALCVAMICAAHIIIMPVWWFSHFFSFTCLNHAE
jgi:hypothetical protein